MYFYTNGAFFSQAILGRVIFSHTLSRCYWSSNWDNWSANQSSFHWARPVATNGAFVVDLMYFQRMVEVKGSKDSPRLTWYFPRRPPNRTRSEFIYTNKTKKKKLNIYIHINYSILSSTDLWWANFQYNFSYHIYMIMSSFYSSHLLHVHIIELRWSTDHYVWLWCTNSISLTQFDWKQTRLTWVSKWNYWYKYNYVY